MPNICCTTTQQKIIRKQANWNQMLIKSLGMNVHVPHKVAKITGMHS